MPKVASASHFVDDILRGIEFPKPRSLHQVEPRDPMIDDNGEGLARERLRYKILSFSWLMRTTISFYYIVSNLFHSIYTNGKINPTVGYETLGFFNL